MPKTTLESHYKSPNSQEESGEIDRHIPKIQSVHNTRSLQAIKWVRYFTKGRFMQFLTLTQSANHEKLMGVAIYDLKMLKIGYFWQFQALIGPYQPTFINMHPTLGSNFA